MKSEEKKEKEKSMRSEQVKKIVKMFFVKKSEKKGMEMEMKIKKRL